MEVVINRRKRLDGIILQGAKLIKCDPKTLAEMDSESIQKSEEQRECKVGSNGKARDMIAGGDNDYVANGPVFIKKRRF